MTIYVILSEWRLGATTTLAPRASAVRISLQAGRDASLRTPAPGAGAGDERSAQHDMHE